MKKTNRLTADDVRKIKRAIRNVTGFSGVSVEIASRIDSRDPETATFDARYWIEDDDALQSIDLIEILRKSSDMERTEGMTLDCYVRTSREADLEGNATVVLAASGQWVAFW